jgi:hypothetical protein
MSLINDALKKAARQRAQEDSGVAPPRPGGGVAESTGQRGPMSTQTMVLIGAAAVVLIVVSAVVTGMLIAGKFESKTAPVAATPAPVAVASAPAVAISMPKPTPAPVVVTPAPVVAVPAPVVVAAPTPVLTAPPAAAPAQAPATVSVIPAPASTPAQAAAAQAQNDMIQNLVDKYHVSGVRAAGGDSKALIDGHVYKQNEFLDRSLGLKLVGVDQDHLTFVDKAGNTYIKSF